MLVSTAAAHLQLMATDQPAPVDTPHLGVIAGPECEATAIPGISVSEKMQGLDVAAGAGVIPVNGGELRAKHVLGGLVFLQGAPDVIHPGIAAPIDSRAKVNDFDIVCKASAIALPIPFIDTGSVVEHQVLQLDAVAGVVVGHSRSLWSAGGVSTV